MLYGVGNRLLTQPQDVVFSHRSEPAGLSLDFKTGLDARIVRHLCEDGLQGAWQIIGFQHMRAHVPNGLACFFETIADKRLSRTQVLAGGIGDVVTVQVFAGQAQLHGGGGFGLLGMRERAAENNGDLVTHSSPGQGTEIILTVPISGE